MAEMEKSGEILDPNELQKGAFAQECDSGVDNTSESGVSSVDGRKSTEIFSSTESLDDPSYESSDKSESGIRIQKQSQDLIEYEKRSTYIECDQPLELRFRSAPKDTTESPAHSAAVLNIVDTAGDKTVNDIDIALDKLPPYFQDIYNGRHTSADFEVSLDERPSWYCDEKFKKGQEFAQNNLFSINYAETLSLFLVFAIKSALEPLVFTGKSDSPFKACQRYLSTLTRVMTWYKDDPWAENSAARRNLSTVRSMHRCVQQKLLEATPEELRQKCSISGKEPTWSSSHSFLLDDFQSACPVPPPSMCPRFGTTPLWVNQLDMAVTQFAFVGLVVTYPKKFGLHFATDEDLEGFLHMWRTIGYLLGIKDKYNFCNVGLSGVRQRTLDFVNIMLKPSLRDVTADWEHMCRCLVQGIAFYVPSFNFETSLKYLCNILNLHMPRLSKSLTLWQSFMVRVVDFTFNVICKIPGAGKLYNFLLLKAIRRGQTASPLVLSQWEKRKFPYMKVAEVPVKEV